MTQQPAPQAEEGQLAEVTVEVQEVAAVEESAPAKQPEVADESAPAGDPNATVEQLRAELFALDATAQTRSAYAKSFKADLGALEKGLLEIDKAVDSYDKARPGLTQQLGDQEEYSTSKHTVIDAAIDERRDDVDAAIAWFEYREAGLQSEADDAEQLIVEKTAAFSERQAEAAAAQAGFAAAKDRVRTLTNGLKDVDGLRTALEKAQDADDIVEMYATIVEFDRLLNDVDLASAADYRAELNDRWSDLNTAQELLRAAELERGEAVFEVTQTKQALADFRADRIGQIVRRAKASPMPSPDEKY